MLSDTKSGGWLLIIYRVPSTPSTSRVMVWKKIKVLGAYLLQQSVYILPNLPEVKEAVNQLKEQIHHLGGESKIIEIATLGEDQDKEVIAGFNANREEEYIEVVKACNELLREIDEESKTEDFHFADLDENEKHLQRVKELFNGVFKRDYFGSSLQAKALALIEECQQQFEEFSREVFSREGIITEDKKTTSESGIKFKQKQTFSREELPVKVQKIVSSLKRNTLEVGGKKVGELSDSIVLEWEYREQNESKSLEIKIEWTTPPNTVKTNKS